MSSNRYRFPAYVSVAQKRAKAEKKLRAMRKKNSNISPVIIEGHALATSWWGKTWNKNLERYADYQNRIGRGRSYLRHGAVLDLQISDALISALVQGSDSEPYSVKIKISRMTKDKWKTLYQSCQGAFDSLADLLAGKFPKSFQKLFFNESSGLFPKPNEISFSCSCPDSASMCKHIAAALYGVGAKLDNNPSLFFSLRSINIEELISKTVSETTASLLSKADSQTKNVILDQDLSEMFGIELVEPKKRSPTNKKKKA